MKDIDSYIDKAGNIKFRSTYRDSMYFVIRDKDKSDLFDSVTDIFLDAFAIGYHFDRQKEIGKKAINHVNLVSIKDRSIKELLVLLILKRKPDIESPKELWREVEKYAEYGIEVLFERMKEKDFRFDLDSIIE